MHPTTFPSLIVLTLISTRWFLAIGGLQSQHSHGRSGCIPAEREALLSFKKGIKHDLENRLASWHGQDCCRWSGVRCSNNTDHVQELDLRNRHPDIDSAAGCDDKNALFGEISPSLLYLEQLEHLDLSWNCLSECQTIPLFLGYIKSLRYLNLSGIPFSGEMPPHLGNLSRLQYLDIGCEDISTELYSTDITWLKDLPLQYLSMSSVILSQISDWPHVLNSIPSLRVINLPSCSLGSANQSLPYLNLTKLDKLDLSTNSFDHEIASCWFWKVTSLKYLKLSYNRLSGQFHEALENMTSLQVLDLSSLKDYLVMEGNFKNLCSLEILDLSGNGMNGDIAVLLDRLPQCAWDVLELHFSSNNFIGTLPNFIGRFTSMTVLDLSNNNLVGIIPLELSNCKSLITLDLSNNQLSGVVPTGISSVTNLTLLDLSSNNFSGIIGEEHLSGLRNLQKIALSSNLLKLAVDTDWLPPFRLKIALLASCQMGPLFPSWLQWQLEITILDISSTALMDEIPRWFWPTFSHAMYIDISNNQLSGKLPTCFETEFSQSIEFLLLSNNNLSGEFPVFLQKCMSLKVLDLSWNGFYGRLPQWTGELTRLQFFGVSHNKFSGSIPSEIINLRDLQFLDLSSNSLSGVIPQHLSNLTAMTLKGSKIFLDTSWTIMDQFGQIMSIFMKGQLLRYGTTLAFFVGIDLSSNSLTGEIPSDISFLDAIINLNLSSNRLSGKIPSKIGAMKSVESLDLSMNNLLGEIPSSLSSLTSLSYLNLSYNNLSGRIPSGRQLDTLSVDNPTLMYIGNNGLCGPPLPNNCSGNNSFINGYPRSSKHKLELMSFNLGLILGFVVGLWMVFCALLFIKTCRIAYYRVVDNLYDGFYVFVVVKWTSLTSNNAAAE